jgi:hypothetical protein
LENTEYNPNTAYNSPIANHKSQPPKFLITGIIGVCMVFLGTGKRITDKFYKEIL